MPTDRLYRLNGPSAGFALRYEAFHAEKLMEPHRETAKNPVGIDFGPQERVTQVRTGLGIAELVIINA